MVPPGNDETHINVTGRIDSARLPMWTECPQCKARNEPAFIFCGECGAPLPERVPATEPVGPADGSPIQAATAGRRIRTCPQCGELNESNFKFCGTCGAVAATEQPAEDHALVGASSTEHAVKRPETKRPGATQWVSWILVCLACIPLLIWAIAPSGTSPTQTSQRTDDVLSYSDFEYFVEHHNIRAIAVNQKTGDVVGYYRIPADRLFRAKMPAGDWYLYETLRKDGAEVILK